MSRFGAGRFVAVTAALLVLTVLAPSRGAAREIGPEADLCSSASVDFDDIVLTRSEPPPAPSERQEEEK